MDNTGVKNPSLYGKLEGKLACFHREFETCQLESVKAMEWYSSIVLDHVTSPRNVGRIADANAVGRAGVQGQGNYLVLYLYIEGEEIKRACFQTFGCPAAIASGSLMTLWLKGKSIEEAKKFTAEELKSPLGR